MMLAGQVMPEDGVNEGPDKHIMTRRSLHVKVI